MRYRLVVFLISVLPMAALQSVAAEERVVFEEQQFASTTGKWRYRLVQFTDAFIETSHEIYPVFGIEVRNDTSEPLLCTGAASFRPLSDQSVIEEVHSALVMPGVQLAVVANSDIVKAMVSGYAQCVPHKIAPLSENSSECHLKSAPKRPFPDWEYPPGARRQLESDVVTIEFLMPAVEQKTPLNGARPTDGRIIDSRGIRLLDRAALEYLKLMRFETNCPGTLHRIQVEFRATPCRYCYLSEKRVIVRLQ